MNPFTSVQSEAVSWEGGNEYMVRSPAETWPLWTVLFVSPSLTCGSTPRLSPGSSAPLSLSVFQEAGISAPSETWLWPLHPHPSLKPVSLSFSQNQHMPPPAGLISVTCTTSILLGQLQIPVSFSMFSSLPFNSQALTLSQHFIPPLIRHAWPSLNALTNVTEIIFVGSN